MKRKIWTILTTAVILTLVLVTAVQASSTGSDLAKVRKATAQFHSPEVAQAAGYTLVPGLDACFDNPGTGGMGFHYIDVAALDATVDLLHPEAMVYAPTADGYQLGAVEYIVPAAAWDASNSEPPMLMGQQFHLNSGLGVYVLHAWVWKNNPAGIFEDWNSSVACS